MFLHKNHKNVIVIEAITIVIFGEIRYHLKKRYGNRNVLLIAFLGEFNSIAEDNIVPTHSVSDL